MPDGTSELLDTGQTDTGQRHLAISTAHGCPVGLYKCERDSEGKLSLPYINPAFYRHFELDISKDYSDPVNVFANLQAASIDLVFAGMAQSEANMERFVAELALELQCGSVRWLRAEAEPYLLGNGAIGWDGAIVDVTSEVEQRHALGVATQTAKDEQARIERITQNMPGGIYETLNTGALGSIQLVFSNRAHSELHGLAQQEMFDDVALTMHGIHADDNAYVLEQVGIAIETMTTRTFEYRYHHPKHGLRWHQTKFTPVANTDGTISCYGWLVDITDDMSQKIELRDAKEAAEKTRADMEQQSLHDALTRLPNRRYLDQMLLTLNDDDPTSERCILRIDLDHFKMLNDSHGHDAGDAVLAHIGAQISGVVGSDGFSARIGGDEFVIILNAGRSEAFAKDIAQDIASCMQKPFFHKGRPCRIGISFGIVSNTIAKGGAWDLMSYADDALYSAKAAGRNRSQVLSREMYQNLLQDRRLLDDLVDAINEGQFVPYFQPQVSAKHHDLTGVEVLARWIHPDLGMISPGVFLPLARQMNVESDIDTAIFNATLDLLQTWEAKGITLPKVSFNLSAGRLHTLGTDDIVKSARRVRTPIAFELLETILLEEEDQKTWDTIKSLRQAGFRIEIDDFGSGHASIVGLTQVQPDVLKIDKRLVDMIEPTMANTSVISAVVAIATSLGIPIIAEGVEDMHQAKVLADLGCDHLQGYVFAKPMSGDVLLTWQGVAHPMGGFGT